MAVIYEPRGKAREYSELACNLYKGCSHACIYCYAPGATFTARETFSSHSYIRPRPLILQDLAKDAEKMAGDHRSILLSFTSDAYQPAEKDFQVTRKALGIMALYGLRPQILTKGGPWAINRDMDLLRKSNAIWAASLTSDQTKESLEWEPGAALPDERIAALKIAKAAGLQTWVSFEPVINPEAVYRLIDQTHSFVDLYKVGKLNYHPHAKTIDWTAFLVEVEKRLDHYGKQRYIKKDLEAYRHSTAA